MFYLRSYHIKRQLTAFSSEEKMKKVPTRHIFEIALLFLTFFPFFNIYSNVKFLLLAPGSGARSAFSNRIRAKFELLGLYPDPQLFFSDVSSRNHLLLLLPRTPAY
jgi:hypothetical protein